MSEPIPDPQAVAETVAILLKPLKLVFAGQPRHVQGALLAEALAIFLAGHANVLREQLLAVHIEYVRRLLPQIELELFGERGHPCNKRDTS